MIYYLGGRTAIGQYTVNVVFKGNYSGTVQRTFAIFSSGTKTKAVGKKKTSIKLSKLKSKKKYYVRIRIYKTVKINGKSQKIYSGWSKSKSVKVK